MRISDWISDVCSSDLRLLARAVARRIEHHHVAARQLVGQHRKAREIAQLGLHAAGAIGAPGSSIERRQRVLGALGRIDLQVLGQGEGEGPAAGEEIGRGLRSEEHTSELQSLMRISYAVFCLKKKRT